MRLSLLLTGLLAAAPLPSQLAPCESLNDMNDDVVQGITGVTSGFSTTIQSWQIIPTSDVTVRSMRIFTEHAFLGQRLSAGGWPFMKLELWSDSASSEPGVRLGGGVWEPSGIRGLAWQGANFDVPVSLTRGVQYWIVFTEPGWARVPEEPMAAAVPKLLWDQRNGNWLNQPPAAVKYRMYCGPLDATGVTVHGATCLSSNGSEATLFSNEIPLVGNLAFSVEGGGFPGGAGAIFMLGVDPTWVSLPFPFFPPGCALHTDVVLAFSSVTATGMAAGHVRFPIPLARNPALMGGFLSAQVGVVDTGSPASIPVVMSNAIRVTVQ